MIIRDEIHGNLEFTSLEERIIDCPDFQRLRRIKQMSVTSLVYPGATHTRFEHSLGTAYLSSKIASKVEMSDDEVQVAKLHGLLHDIGHTAFSHEGEDILRKYIGDHEEIGRKKALDGPIRDIIGENYNVTEVLKDNLLVSSDIGSDRMDYLKRDAMNTGVAYGLIDIDRIVHTIALDDELYIRRGGLAAAEYLLIARFMMFSTVYLHKTVRIATAMLYRAIENSILDGIDPKSFSVFDDEEAGAAIGRHMEDIRNRRLFKEVASIDRKLAHPGLEKELSEEFGIDIIVDVPREFFKPVSFKVESDEGLVEISQASDLVGSLKAAEEKRMKVLILASRENKEKFGARIQSRIDAFQSELQLQAK